MEENILQKIIEFDCSLKAVLCTQIVWKGSVPRKDYPMMLVDKNRNIIGTIGGGVLEHSIIELSKTVIESGEPLLKTFNLTNHDVTKDGSICGGTTTVLIESFTKIISDILKSIKFGNDNDNSILVTNISFNSKDISRQIVTKSNMISYPNIVIDSIEEVQKTRISKSVKISDQYYLIQYFGLTPTLHIFGAGHVGQAVAEIAQYIGIKTSIYDERKDLNNSIRFPYAVKINTSELSEIINCIEICPIDYVLVATRGHKHDFEIMQWLLQKDISYVGLVSSSKKWQLLSEALLKGGISNNKIDEVHSPIGLDIGSETVPEIAISIIAELINHYRKGDRSVIALSKL